jgi:hypothetical protein
VPSEPTSSRVGGAQNHLAHGAIAHRVGARRPGRRHAAQRRVGPGVYGKEKPGVAQVFVELLARDARLDPAVQVVRIDLNNLVHLGEVYADPAAEGRHVAFERGARAKRDHRTVVGGADLDDLGDLLGGLGEGDRVGRMAGMIGLGVPVLIADRGRRR